MRSVSALVKLFRENGFTLLRQTNHQIWRCPCGHTQIVSSGSPSGGRGDHNCKARIRRTLRECEQNLKTEETPE